MGPTVEGTSQSFLPRTTAYFFSSISKFPEFHYHWCCFLNTLVLSSAGLLEFNSIKFLLEFNSLWLPKSRLWSQWGGSCSKGSVEPRHFGFIVEILVTKTTQNSGEPQYSKASAALQNWRVNQNENNCFEVTHLQWPKSQTPHSISSFRQTVTSRRVGDLSSCLHGNQVREYNILKQITDWSSRNYIFVKYIQQCDPHPTSTSPEKWTHPETERPQANRLPPGLAEVSGLKSGFWNKSCKVKAQSKVTKF